MRRALVLCLVATCLALVGCSDDKASDPPSDPMNAVVELGRPVERGYERTEWDPTAQEAAMDLAQRVTGTSIGCVDPSPIAFEEVKKSYELVSLPMPGAVVQCFSILEEEDLTFSAFTDAESKQTYIDAKAELICGRALAPESDPSVASRFDGIVYVDAGNNVIIEPDSFQIRDLLAAELGATPTKMCADAVGDRLPATADTQAG